MKAKNIKKLITGFCALSVAASISAVTAFATIPELADPQPASLEVETERSGHTYKYYQIFTGTWHEDEDGKIWLSDAGFGKDLDRDGLIAYLKDNYADEINQIYVNRAIKVKLVEDRKNVNTGESVTTIDDVKTAFIEWKGEEAWASSDYNIDNFASSNTNDRVLCEDILDLFKVIQEKYPDRADDTVHIAGEDYSESSDHGLSVTRGNKIIIDIMRQFKTGEGTAIDADYNNKVTVNVDNGYYLVTETDEGWDKEGKNAVSGASREAVLMKIVDRKIEITPKLGTPTVEKKILENIKDVESVGDSLIGGYNNITAQKDYNYVPSENKDKNKWITNLDESTLKNQWNDAADYSIGDIVPFAIFGTLPENIDDYKHYYYHFEDTLAKGFDAPTASDIKIQIGKTTPVQTPADGDNAAVNRGFTGTDVTDKAKITIAKNADGSTKIDIVFDDIKAAGVDLDIDSTVLVTYKTELNKNAVIGNKGNTNGVNLEYSIDVNYDGNGIPDTPPETPPETPETPDTHPNSPPTDKTHDDGVVAFTYEVDLTKVDSKTREELQNAIFTLQAKSGDHEGQYVVIDANGKVDHWTDKVEEANYMISSAGGSVIISGLDDGAYELVEVKAPKGYHSLREPIQITINAKLNKTGDYIYIKDDGSAAFLDFNKGDTAAEAPATVDKEAGIYKEDIGNNKGITLPETGGAGAVALYSIGGLLTVAGGTYYATKKKSKNTDTNENDNA